VINDVKRDLINAYNLYVDSKKAKEPVLQMLADAGEPFCKRLVNEISKTIANIDALAAAPPLLFRQLNKILGEISAMKSDPESKVRSFIHDNVKVTKESERNYREHLKSKFEMILHRLSSILEKQAKILRAFMPTAAPLAGGMVEPERKELSKEKLLMFTRTPAAQAHGLDSLDVMERVLFYPDLKQKLTTLINAIDRGHVPADGPEIMQATKEIMDAFKAKETNAEQFGEEKE
jgi:regulator of sigma D